MGVNGLMTYVSNSRDILKQYKCRNTKIIIDGYNLMYSIYLTHNISWLYGGEYDKYEKAIRKFFIRLKECDLEPIVILDGCYNSDNVKFETTLKRFNEKLKTCNIGNKNGFRTGCIFPLLMIQTFVAVLKSLNIIYITCYEEADREIAALANFFSCPVLSNDSDFFIYKLPSGYMPINKFNFISTEENCDCCEEEKHHYFNALIYNQKDLTQYNSKFDELLPLFATLSGNDFAKKDSFKSLYNRLKITKKSNSSKFQAILKYLEPFQDLSSAIDDILSQSPQNYHKKLSDIISNSIKQYNLSDSQLVKYFQSITLNIECMSNLLQRFPESVLFQLQNQFLMPCYLNAVTIGKVFLQVSVESTKLPSVHRASQVIRFRIYQKLREYIPEFDNCIEYSRNLTNIHVTQLDLTVEPDRPLGPMLEITNHSAFIKVLIDEWFLVIDDSFKKSPIILGVISSLILQYSWQTELAKPNSDFQKKQHSHALIKYFKEPVRTKDFNLKIVHYYNELQSIYFALTQYHVLYNDVQTIDRYYNDIPQPQQIFNGFLIYNLCNFLQKSKSNDAKEYLTNAVLDKFPCQQFFSFIKQYI